MKKLFTDQIYRVRCVDILGKLVFGVTSVNLEELWGKQDRLALSICTFSQYDFDYV